LTRRELSDAVSAAGWRLVLAMLRTNVRVESLKQATELATEVVAALGAEVGGRLLMDVRGDRVIFTIENLRAVRPNRSEIDMALRISAVATDLGLSTSPDIGVATRSVQAVEIGIDALDIPAIRPFWKAVMAYADEPGRTGPADAIVDPFGQGPAIWFQQMDAPRRQRNRIHFDVSVPHDEAADRLQAALDAGGSLLSAAEAPAFWVLADAEGNEACITTWQGRD
jgi:4a-hydroxytetrahydrobiopterin dehydratase